MKNNYNFKSVLVAAGMLLGTSAIAQTYTFTYTGAIETFTVPAGATDISIECWGAQGAGDNGTPGGMGAYMSGNFSVTPGDEFKILVGGQGTNDPSGTNASGGGGGTFVTDLSDNPFVIAGGGGGTNGAPLSGSQDAPVTNDGLDGNSDAYPFNFGVGGTAGGGATNSSAGSGPCAGNGGGLLTNGQDPSCCAGLSVGVAFVNGGDEATIGGCGVAATGGFGGGGAGGNHGCGGGGGYGGGGANYHYPGNAGGGGSYNDGTDQVNIAGDNAGDGQVIITVLCDGLTTTTSSTTLCENEELILHAESTNGGTITWDLGVEDSVGFTPDSVGTITYTATSTDPDDCEAQVTIVSLEAPQISLTAQDVLTGSDGAVFLTLISGVFPFTYDWDNDGTGDFDDPQSITDLDAGDYVVVTEHANGCQMSLSATVSSQLTLIETENSPAKVYPNPTADETTIEFPGAFDFVITNTLGEVVLKGSGKDKKMVNVSSLSDGNYLISVNADNKSYLVKLTKK